MLDRSYTNLTLDELESIGLVYEQAINGNRQLSPAEIEQALDKVDEKLKPYLLRELLQHVFVQGQNRESESGLQTYLDHFADHRQIVLEVFTSEKSRRAEQKSASSNDTKHADEDSLHLQVLEGLLEPSDEEDSLGRLAGYEVQSVIGSGGMGLVLKARDPRISRPVAIKLLSPELTRDLRARNRFMQEARAAGAIQHPHVVGIHSVEDQHEPPFLVLEYVTGHSLADLLEAEHQFSLEQIVTLTKEIVTGLGAAHAAGIVHRDLKPANILIDDQSGAARITDFGLARAIDDPELTVPGEILGTPRYMSPEQIEGLPLDRRSDFFSLGTLLYRLSTGEHPFPGKKPITLARQICDHQPRSPQAVNQELPKWFSDLIQQLMQKEPADRPASAEEILKRLDQPEKETKGQTSKRVPIAFAVSGLLVAVLYFVVTSQSDPNQTSEESVIDAGDPQSGVANLNPVDTPIMSKEEAVPDIVQQLIDPSRKWSEPYRAVEMELPVGKQVCPAISADNQTLCFSIVQGNEQSGVYFAKRREQSEPWKVSEKIAISIEGVAHIDDVEPASDMNSLLFAAEPENAVTDSYKIGMVTRNSDLSWGTPEWLTEVNSDEYESSPSLSNDRQMLVFTSYRQPSVGRRDIWISTRPDVKAVWSEPELAGEPLNSSQHDIPNQLLGEPSILVLTRHENGPRDVYLSWRTDENEWAEPVPMPTPFDNYIEAIWIFDEGESIVYQTASNGWEHSELRIVHHLNN